jgi:ATP-dependent DNA helicase RecG
MAIDVDKSLPESDICEWKWSWRDEYMKWMSAFAYTAGGTLHIGVNDDGYVVGLKDYRKLLEDLPNKFRDKLHITPFVRLRHVDTLGANIRYNTVPESIASKQINRYSCGIFNPQNNKQKNLLEKWKAENPVCQDEDGRYYYLEIEVEHHTTLVTYNGVQYTRSGSTLQMIEGSELEEAALRLSDTRQNSYFVNKVYPAFKVSDLRQDLINRARDLAVAKKTDHEWKGMDNEGILRSCGLILTDETTGKEGITLAAILLFGTDNMIKSVCFQHRTDAIVRIIDVDRFDDRDVITTNLVDSYDRLMSFGKRHLNDRFVLNETEESKGLENVQNVSARDKILREIVGNILMHRDFSSGHVARMVIEKDQIEIVNANRPHGHGNLDLQKFSPYQKNPAISQVFREMGLADELGSGMRNSYKFTKLYSGGTPTFTEDGDLFRIIIPLSEAATVSAGPKKKEQKKKVKTIAENGTVINLSQSDIIRIINFCGEPKTKTEIMEFVEAKSAEYFRKTILKPLVDAKYLLMTEPSRSSKQRYIGFNQRTSN